MSLLRGVVAATIMMMMMMTSRGQRTILDEAQHSALMALYDEAGLNFLFSRCRCFVP